MVKGTCALAYSLYFGSSLAQTFKISTRDDIIRSAATLAYDTMSFYKGNQTGMIPGILPGPPSEHKGDYYWWEGGAFMGTMIDYWYLTGDSSYNHVVMEGMLHQVGEGNDYMPRNHTASLGNDDQGFWAMSAMLAAENKFPDPPSDKPQWLMLAESVWATQADPIRHDSECNGGMRWQIPFSNNGYNYKNTIANGCFFNLGARLARYTGNDTYAQYATKTWDWLWDIGYIDHKSWSVYDGANVETQCKDINPTTYSYNAAILLQGAAFLYNYTEASEIWKVRVDSLLNATLERFFPDLVAFELSCEGYRTCSTDMLSFKGYVHRWLSVVAQVAPFTADIIEPVLRKSTEAAISQCTGGASGRVCGFYWSSGAFVDPLTDGTSGAGESMNVLAAVSSLLHGSTGSNKGPVTNSTGGTSKGNPSHGSGAQGWDEKPKEKMTVGDKAGAGILTVLLLTLGEPHSLG